MEFLGMKCLGIALICCLVVFGCISQSPTLSAVGDAPPVDRDATGRTGVWFRGLHLEGGDTEAELVGVVLATDAGPAPGHDELLEALANAPIVATFRSAREAAIVDEQVSANSAERIRWVRAEFAGSWDFQAMAPPATDPLPNLDLGDLPIGDADAGIGSGIHVFALPPPLQQRGILVSQSRPKGNGTIYVMPRDRSLSVFTSWEDAERRLKDAPPRSLVCWRNGAKMTVPWSDRESLKQGG